MLVALVFGLNSLIHQFDVSTNRRDRTVVANGLAQRLVEIDEMVIPQAMWDDAVRHLDNRYDAGWASLNVGKYLNQTNGFDFSFVLDARNAPIFAAADGHDTDVGRYREVAQTAAVLAGSVRAREEARGALARPADGGMVASAIQEHALVTWRGQMVVLTATLVEPDFGTAMPRGRRAPIIVTGMIIDTEFLQRFAERFLIEGLRLTVGPAPTDNPATHLSLRSLNGDAIGDLSWTSRRPGYVLLRGVVVPAVLIVCFLAATALVLMRRSKRMAADLIDGESRAHRLAYFDALSGLPNRVSLYDYLRNALKAAKDDEDVAVLCIDIDRFKEISDTFGHHAGDELIQIAAGRFARECGDDAYLARLSGDEFAVVHHGSAAEASDLADRLCKAMTPETELEAGRAFVGCSIGVTILTDARVEPGEALRQADLALYRAKKEGRGCFRFFEPDMDEALKTRRQLEADLRDAIATDSLRMVYQPQVESDGTLVGVEALMRWDHPTRGPISPALFVPIAEESGLISGLGLLAFRHTFAASRQWPDLPVAINVSASQLRLPDFLAQLRRLADEYGINPRRFELEITEGVLIKDNPAIRQTLDALRSMGFTLALDDFGTGYSALSYLRNYPIDKIKIDRSFVVNLGIDRDADAVVAAIVRLARALKLKVIAEGVETYDQRDRLASVGCSQIQGYLYSKPIESDALTALIEHNREMSETRAA